MPAFLLTWKESGWPHENIVRMAEMFGAHGHVDELWRLRAHRSASVGDRVWLLRQGRGQKGIFGRGELIGPPRRDEASSGKLQWMAPVRFDRFVDPLQKLLVSGDNIAKILRPAQINAQASGDRLEDGQSAQFESLLKLNEPILLGGVGDWTKPELEAVVGDYFAMLDAELSSRPYSKTTHRQALQTHIKRSKGSVERKRANISAVLEQLGLPWIKGYKPQEHYQDALLDEVELQLGTRLSSLDSIVAVRPPAINIRGLFVFPPVLEQEPTRKPSLARVARKFDVAARDAANRSLGKAGEEFVFNIERQRLTAAGQTTHTTGIRWTARDLGDGLGYDIESFETDGTPIFIEVKTTRGPIGTPFFLSGNELRASEEKGPAYRLYRVFSFGSEPHIYCIRGPLENQLHLEPISYRARARMSSSEPSVDAAATLGPIWNT